MKYKSTRAGVKGLSFKETVLMGLAGDGGLLVPEQVPRPDLEGLRSLSYRELAFAIYKLFIDDIPDPDLKGLVDKSYASFSTDEVVRLKDIGELSLLELFHGPTLSFKDIALQFLGNIFEYILAESRGRLNVLGATSGDTGSAAIYGLKGKNNIRVFILHPSGKVSPVQELQMTTVEDANIFNIAIRGTFDDCQKIVKDIFNDIAFKREYSLGAVNSINWARILAQTVYYFYAYFRSGKDRIDVAVPTGNFGDIFAGYLAKRMGLPIRRLILATNENDILSRFVNHGDYSTRAVVRTISPAMDIQIASNFERYLYYFYAEDGDRTKRAMQKFLEEGSLLFTREEVEKIQCDFSAFAVTTPEAVKVIEEVYLKHNYFLCPHTACGVGAAKKTGDRIFTVCLATAHPAKFPEVVKESTGLTPPVPEGLSGLEGRQKRMVILNNDREEVKAYLREKALPADQEDVRRRE